MYSVCACGDCSIVNLLSSVRILHISFLMNDHIASASMLAVMRSSQLEGKRNYFIIEQSN